MRLPSTGTTRLLDSLTSDAPRGPNVTAVGGPSSTEPAPRLPDPDFWRGKRVLLTGHTGFKGAWLALWLHRLGAEVVGYALSQPDGRALFHQAGVASLLASLEGDVRDADRVAKVVTEHRPEIVIHMAAQSLVRYSYRNPLETYATNVMGTVHVLDAVRRAGGVRVVLS